MTSRSRRKRQITAQTFIRAIRTEALASAVAASLAAASFTPTAFAQSPVAFGTTPTALIPVEPIRSAPQPRAQSPAAQQPPRARSTATLRWRQSPLVTSTETAQPTAKGQSSRPATLRRAAVEDSLAGRKAIPVTYLENDSASAPPDAFGLPAGDGALPPRTAQKPTADPFLNPFNDSQVAAPIGPLSRERSLIPAHRETAGLRLQSVPQQQPQDPDAVDSLDVPIDPDVEELEPGAVEPPPRDSNPFPPRADQVPSASDLELPDQRLPDRETPEENLRDPQTRAPRFDRRSVQREEPSCDELRERIAERSIRKVSLDISPPFRPDVLALDEYEMLKEEFVEEQATRQWRSADGELLANGRLIDMAFENVIVETESGQELELSLAELSEPDLAYVTEAWGLPRECQLPQVAFEPREWLPMKMTWKASELCHKPLYFEEVSLERYGHTAGPFAQPVISTAHFFFNIAVLPYKMGIHPPSECQYALGYYRPGNCAPWIVPPVPLSLRGALAETAVVGGMIALIP